MSLGFFFRNAWISLGDLSKSDAMSKFVDEVSAQMPLLKPFLEAHKKVEENNKKG